MCEQLVARAAEPFRLDSLWDLVEQLERWGLAGFGWGAAWLTPAGTLEARRTVVAFRDDPGREPVGAIETTSLLVHLRRPSKLSTFQLADTQPFVDPAGRFAFGHNGELADQRAARRRYQEEDRIHGRADSEVGERWLEDRWAAMADTGRLLAGLHDAFGGVANLATLAAGGACHHYAGNPENPVFAYRLGTIGVASTGLYSIDRSLFRFAARGATDRRLVRPGHTIALDANGWPGDGGGSRA
jgi:glutamine phosphoribosylpyrophosphate amidotransferase